MVRMWTKRKGKVYNVNDLEKRAETKEDCLGRGQWKDRRRMALNLKR